MFGAPGSVPNVQPDTRFRTKINAMMAVITATTPNMARMITFDDLALFLDLLFCELVINDSRVNTKARIRNLFVMLQETFQTLALW